MKIFNILSCIFFALSANSYAGIIYPVTKPSMCLTAYLVNKIKTGDITFFYKNQAIGNISIYGTWTDIISINDGGYFINYKDFKEKRKFLRVMNTGYPLDAKYFTYQTC